MTHIIDLPPEIWREIMLHAADDRSSRHFTQCCKQIRAFYLSMRDSIFAAIPDELQRTAYVIELARHENTRRVDELQARKQIDEGKATVRALLFDGRSIDSDEPPQPIKQKPYEIIKKAFEYLDIHYLRNGDLVQGKSIPITFADAYVKADDFASFLDVHEMEMDGRRSRMTNEREMYALDSLETQFEQYPLSHKRTFQTDLWLPHLRNLQVIRQTNHTMHTLATDFEAMYESPQSESTETDTPTDRLKLRSSERLRLVHAFYHYNLFQSLRTPYIDCVQLSKEFRSNFYYWGRSYWSECDDDQFFLDPLGKSNVMGLVAVITYIREKFIQFFVGIEGAKFDGDDDDVPALHYDDWIEYNKRYEAIDIMITRGPKFFAELLLEDCQFREEMIRQHYPISIDPMWKRIENSLPHALKERPYVVFLDQDRGVPIGEAEIAIPGAQYTAQKLRQEEYDRQHGQGHM